MVWKTKGTNANKGTNITTTSNSFETIGNIGDMDDERDIDQNKTPIAQVVSCVDGNWQKEKHMTNNTIGSCDQQSSIEKVVNLESASMTTTTMGDQDGSSDSEVEEVDDKTT